MQSEPRPDTDPPTALHQRAMDDLRFIRRTMERAGAFTAIPGWGTCAVGVLGVAGAVLASQQPSADRWLAVWLGTALLAVLLSAVTIHRKASRAGVPLSHGPGRTFLVSFLPPVGVAAALTGALHVRELTALLPGVWLLSYGAAFIAAGAWSIRIVPLTGIGFMLLGALALITPSAWGNGWMAGGFGLLHIGLGVLIARSHGG